MKKGSAWWGMAMVLAGPALWGCTENSPDLGLDVRHGSLTASSPTSWEPQTEERQAPPAPNLPLVGQAVAVPITKTIDWKSALAGPQLPAHLLREDQVREVSDAPLPMLVPNRPALLSSAILMTGPHWVAATLRHDGHQVYVHGTRVEHVVPGLALSKAGQAIVDRGFVVTRNEGIMTLSLKLYGGAYHIDVECEDHERDLRCTEESYVVELANSLAMVGGER